jgi:hypothetical protein
VQLLGFSTSVVRAENPRQPSLPAGLATPAETQMLQAPSMLLGQARRLAPSRDRLPSLSITQPLSSPFLGGG